MPLVDVAKARRKTNSRGRRPSKSLDDRLRDQMERVFSASWAKGIRRLKGGVSRQKMADAYYSGDYAAVMIEVPFEKFNEYLAEAIGQLARATVVGADEAAKTLPDLNSLRYDLDNPAMRTYLAERTGALVNYVQDDFGRTVTGLVTGRYGPEVRSSDLSDNFQAQLQEQVRQRLAQGAKTSEIRTEIGEQLRASIGLDWVSAGALARARDSGKFDGPGLAAYEDRLLDRRAERISRTEVAFAMNAGQQAVWDAAQDQDLLGQDAAKVWVCDANPCEYCAPMDGVMVALRDEFLTPGGERVMSPPLHPHCYCIVSLSTDGDEIDAPRKFDRR